MFYLCLFFIFLSQTLINEEPIESIRMGFDHEKCAVSVIFPNENALKLTQGNQGNQVYYSHSQKKDCNINYQFGFHGLWLDGISSFKDQYLKDLKNSLSEKNSALKSTILFDQDQGGKRRVVLEHNYGSKRTLFVGEFYLIKDEIYLASETIEVLASEPVDVSSLIDESFFNSLELVIRS